MRPNIFSLPLKQIWTATEPLVLFLFSDKTQAIEKTVDQIANGLIGQLRQQQSPEPTHCSTSYLPDGRLICISWLGMAARSNLETLRLAAARAGAELKKSKQTKAIFVVPKISRSHLREITQSLVEALLISTYSFSFYKTETQSQWSIQEIFIASGDQEKTAVKAGIETGQIIAEAVNQARDLGNHPANIATPEHIAEHARTLAKKEKSIKVKVLGRTELQNLGMRSILAVAQGSDEEPKFIILQRIINRKKPIVLVGKGVTFDSGGLSIKPAERMEEMKFDMAGAATVLGIFQAAAELRMRVNLIGLIPCAENLPSGRSIKPGDIIKSADGKTIEVVNTDAEGRLLLADALSYAKKFQPALVIDFATLTGSIVGALGEEMAGAFTNREALIKKLRSAAAYTNEKIWPMPLDEEYESYIKSDFADLRNIGNSRYGDAIIAATFLHKFVDYPWIHLDIAGVAYYNRNRNYRGKGATGIGVRLVIEYLKRFFTK